MLLAFPTLILGFGYVLQSAPIDRKQFARWQRTHLLGYLLIATGIPGGIVAVLTTVSTKLPALTLVNNALAVLMVAEIAGAALLYLIDHDFLAEQTAPPALAGTALESAEEYIKRGSERANLGDVNGAILDFSAALALDPQNVTVYFLRGKAYIRVDRIKAADDFKKVLELEPNHPQALTLRNFVKDAG